MRSFERNGIRNHVDRIEAGIFKGDIVGIVARRCVVSENQQGRLDRVVQELTRLSRAEVRGLFDHDCVTSNGAPCREAGTIVATGDMVEVRYDPHQRYRERPRAHAERAFRLVYEDEHLLVVDKAAIVLTVPTEQGETNTLLDAVDRYLVKRNRRSRAIAVHRLDRGTSGLLVFAANPMIAAALEAQFREHKPERIYAAIVAGIVTPSAGTFDNRLTTNKALQRHSTRRADEGERAVTHFRTVRSAHRATLVHAWLETGRRNQIRVHFAEAGHPVLGDPRYRPETSRHPRWKARRLALHAWKLGFRHPVSNTELTFESPLPAEFVHFFGKTP